MPAAPQGSLIVALSAPRRRYLVRLGISMAVYVVALIAGKYLVEREIVAGPVTVWLLALLPGLAVVGAFASIGLLIVETKDEFIRMLLVRQVLYATGITLSLATVWGFLEMYRLVEHVEAFWIAVIWLFSFGLSGLINKLTLGSWGEWM